ncbi:hypothetical protein V2J09_022764 [Rumex salicifolius]
MFSPTERIYVARHVVFNKDVFPYSSPTLHSPPPISYSASVPSYLLEQVVAQTMGHDTTPDGPTQALTRPTQPIQPNPNSLNPASPVTYPPLQPISPTSLSQLSSLPTQLPPIQLTSPTSPNTYYLLSGQTICTHLLPSSPKL